MKKSLILISALIAGSVFAQEPFGASGPGVTVTKREVGVVISVGEPVTRNISVGQECQTQQQYQPQRHQEGSAVNPGTVIGALVGGAIGSQVGGGQGRDYAIAAGAVTGAMIGNRDYQQNQNGYNSNYQQPQQVCREVFEQRVIGYSYTAQWEYVQVKGFNPFKQPKIGERVEIIVKQTIYTGSVQQQ